MTESSNFVEFFKERVAHFDDERKIFNDYINLVLPDKMECHNLEWENRKLEDATSTAKLSANNIDMELRKAQAQIESARSEITTLKSSKETRLQQITRLSELSQPIQHDTTYLIPEKFSVSLPTTIKTERKTYDPVKNNNPYKLPRTGEVTKLELRLNEETVRAASHLQDLHSLIRDTEEERHRHTDTSDPETESYYRQAELLLADDDKYDVQCFLSVSELLKLRARIMVAQREEVEELERLQIDKRYYLAKEEKTRQQLLLDMSQMRRRIKNELDEANAQFKVQLHALDAKLKILRDKEREINEEHSRTHVYEDRLNAALKEAKEKYDKLRRRNALELEGYQNEAVQLRTRLTHVEKQYRWQLLRNQAEQAHKLQMLHISNNNDC